MTQSLPYHYIYIILCHYCACHHQLNTRKWSKLMLLCLDRIIANLRSLLYQSHFHFSIEAKLTSSKNHPHSLAPSQSLAVLLTSSLPCKKPSHFHPFSLSFISLFCFFFHLHHTWLSITNKTILSQPHL